jgi:PrgI family protein
MAVYKVIQDIESEDKLLGPLTLRGLVYAMIVAACIFIDFRLVTATALGPLKWLIILILLFPMALFTTLALPLGGPQPTEVWLLSRIRFMLQSRKRIWNQSGLINLVTITAPKKIEAMLTKNLSQTEVKSRLEALANTLDSRGWVVKNVNVNMGAFGGYFSEQENSERLVDAASVVKEVPVIDVHASDDILDEKNNATAQKMESKMIEAEVQRKQELQNKLEAARNAKPEPEEDEYVEHGHQETIHNVRSLNPLPAGFGIRSKDAKNSHKSSATTPVTDKGRAAKLELAQSGNDLSVASIAKLAGRNDGAINEVAIALH